MDDAHGLNNFKVHEKTGESLINVAVLEGRQEISWRMGKALLYLSWDYASKRWTVAIYDWSNLSSAAPRHGPLIISGDSTLAMIFANDVRAAYHKAPPAGFDERPFKAVAKKYGWDGVLLRLDLDWNLRHGSKQVQDPD